MRYGTVQYRYQYKLNEWRPDPDPDQDVFEGSSVLPLHGGQASAQSSQATGPPTSSLGQVQTCSGVHRGESEEFRVGWVLTLQSQPIQRPRV